MATVALVMAGGRGERMRASGIDRPKPLVTVRGIPLVEWNVRRLVDQGLNDILVAVASGDAEVREFAEGRLAEVAAGGGARLRVLEEPASLGNIGAAGLVGPGPDLLVVFADNLTSLDLLSLLAHHRSKGADLTLASHEQAFRFPYGRLELSGDRVVGYVEKPIIRMRVSTALAVLSPAARELIPTGRALGLADLAADMIARGMHVSAYIHQAPWVDVNDLASLRRAERLVQRHAGMFPSGDPAP
jgi:NDP-sugar pyrophosphorylase family protein